MLTVILSANDGLPAVKLTMEHSLASLSKWEAKYEKPFYGRDEKTEEETRGYLELMILEDDYPVEFYDRLSKDQFKTIADYINSKQSATSFGIEPEKKGPPEIITSELIYFWLVQFQIPFDPTENWHINRLMTLVKIAGIKQSKPKKMNKQQLAEQYRALNEQRRQESGTAG